MNPDAEGIITTACYPGKPGSLPDDGEITITVDACVWAPVEGTRQLANCSNGLLIVISDGILRGMYVASVHFHVQGGVRQIWQGGKFRRCQQQTEVK